MNYTSIEQSRRLIELGLSPETADMCYMYTKFDGESEPQYFASLSKAKTNDIPCWSEGALLELIPSHLGEFEDGIDFGLSKAFNNKWFCAHYLQMKEDDNGELLMKSIITVTGKTSIEALYKLVCWLIENNHIKTV